MSSSNDAYTFSPIGFLESCFETKNATPRQPGVAPSSRARLALTTTRLNNPAFSLEALDGFSHVWVIFVFHLDEQAQACLGEEAPSGTVKTKVAPPRLGGEKVGVFATRSPHRPAPIGLSLVRLVDVSHDVITLEGADLVNGTPVLDIKPYLPTFDEPAETPQQSTIRVPTWATPAAIFEDDLEVCFTPRATRQLDTIFSEGRGAHVLIEERAHMERLLAEVLAGDPRSRYRRDKCSDRLYFIELDGLHMTVWFDEASGEESKIIAEVLRVRLK